MQRAWGTESPLRRTCQRAKISQKATQIKCTKFRCAICKVCMYECVCLHLLIEELLFFFCTQQPNNTNQTPTPVFFKATRSHLKDSRFKIECKRKRSIKCIMFVCKLWHWNVKSRSSVTSLPAWRSRSKRASSRCKAGGLLHATVNTRHVHKRREIFLLDNKKIKNKRIPVFCGRGGRRRARQPPTASRESLRDPFSGEWFNSGLSSSHRLHVCVRAPHTHPEPRFSFSTTPRADTGV